jgi:nicotinate-nucleotide pyrophosphorylase (carboxylating)
MSELEKTFPDEPWIRELVRQSLAEDIGSGDASTAVTVQGDLMIEALVCAREEGVVAGLPLIDLLFDELDDTVAIKRLLYDGTRVRPGQAVAWLKGPAAAILTGERTLLNFLQNLGGIASVTRRYVDAVAGTACQVLDTRKTLPGYRHLAKYAVRCGGGHNHRLGLYDRVMLKDNHWAAADGSIEILVARSRSMYPSLPIEVEVDSLEQLDRVLPLAVDWILLDNFTFEQTAEAVRRRDAQHRATLLESSGNVTLDTIAGYARAGVDAASVGRLTHSAPALDLGLDMDRDLQ